MNDNEFWFKIMTVFIISATVLILGLVGMYHWKEIQGMKLGFQEVQTMSGQTTIWQKP